MRTGENRSSRLATQLFERKTSVLAATQDRLALFDERTNERPKLVQSRALPLDMLLEGERQLGALLEIPPEDDEGTEDEATQQWIEMRRTHGHDFRYA
ncbi:MAG: hypothetical protein WD380_06505, partial [Gaiellaceae bacterium]